MTTQNAAVESPVEAAVRIAREKAEAMAANASTGTAVATTNQSTAVAMPASGQKISMSDLMTGAMVVDEFIKVDKFGLIVGKDAKPIDKFKAKILMVEGRGYTPNQSIKFGNPVQYLKTYDGAKAVNGKSWPAELDRIRQTYPDVREYPAADLVLTLLEDAGTAKAGQTVGYTTATTSFKHVVKLLQECESKGLVGEEVEVEVGYVRRDKNNNAWGEMVFKVIGPADSE